MIYKLTRRSSNEIIKITAESPNRAIRQHFPNSYRIVRVGMRFPWQFCVVDLKNNNMYYYRVFCGKDTEVWKL